MKTSIASALFQLFLQKIHPIDEVFEVLYTLFKEGKNMVLNSLHEIRETLAHVKDMQWNIERHNVLIKNRTVALTMTEFQLLYPLRSGLPVTYADLAFMVYHCSMDSKVRVMLDKHIDRIRGKLRGTGVYIYCVLGYGYMLFPENWSDECA